MKSDTLLPGLLELDSAGERWVAGLAAIPSSGFAVSSWRFNPPTGNASTRFWPPRVAGQVTMFDADILPGRDDPVNFDAHTGTTRQS